MGRVRFLVTEAFVNIRRNALVVLGAVLAVFVSLVLTFAAVLVAEVVRINTIQWEDGVRVIGFLNTELSPSGVNALTQEVESWDNVDAITYFSQQDAYEEALTLFEEGSINYRIVQGDPTLLPASIRIKPTISEEYKILEERLRATPGIMEVNSPGRALDVMLTIRNFLTQGSLWLAILLGGSAVALIANTIRLAIYARREEVGIMKLVGASNWFVRVPFLLEGMIQGLIGGALAVGAVVVGYQVFVQGRADALPGILRVDVSNDFMVRWGVVLLALSIAVGVVGSGIALRRFLREA